VNILIYGICTVIHITVAAALGGECRQLPLIKQLNAYTVPIFKLVNSGANLLFINHSDLSAGGSSFFDLFGDTGSGFSGLSAAT
jgi:hypothetical protein